MFLYGFVVICTVGGVVMDNKKLVTTKEMAEILSVHENTLFNWAKEGMPRYKLGSNAVRYDVKEVLEWVRTRGEEKEAN